MFNKIVSTLKLANDFKSLIFKRISNPTQTARILSFLKNLKDISTNEKDKSEMIGKALDLTIKFKKENPSDYKELFVIIDEILDEYEKNPSDIKQNLAKFLDSI